MTARTIAVIGGGILGLATAAELRRRGYGVTVLEKEPDWAAHQTGNNSNVVHAGLYYAPGSAKARMSVAGNTAMVGFAREHGVPVEVCGKLVVAVTEDELPALYELARRADANGVPARLVSPAEAREYEPHVACVAALRVESTAIIDYRAVCAALVESLSGADLRPGTVVRGIRFRGDRIELATGYEVLRADGLVNCAGLHADRVAELAGIRPAARIVPFRGEYLHLRGAARDLVRGLIYPVPDASLPFLGVHLTRMLDGSVHAGPNAVLALRREGYRWTDVSPGELASLARYPGLWRLGRRYWRTGAEEVARSLSRKRFAASAARLVPGIAAGDLVAGGAGVRAQAMRADGTLVQDFLLDTVPGQVHVLNAPSPAASCAFQIGVHIADQLSPL
ncbi:L-2-hydroxyglutarate oxidase [Sciscionella marina]|uniref:L-2-hydroxyglutarate oxidase n=1 Tax=Sciscionella marina TaxID=508770 RepID=UPI000373FEAB|nr:L-2-hydroxyglutarate oxidase [Sciscionella marina]